MEEESTPKKEDNSACGSQRRKANLPKKSSTKPKLVYFSFFLKNKFSPCLFPLTVYGPNALFRFIRTIESLVAAESLCSSSKHIGRNQKSYFASKVGFLIFFLFL